MKNTSGRARIILVLLALVIQQFLVFINPIPAHAQSYWDFEGNVIPLGKSAVGKALHPMIRQEHVNIPIYRFHGEPLDKVANHTTLVSITSKQDFVMLGTINGLDYDNVTPPDVQVAAGPTNIMEMVNLKGQIWTKDGVPQGSSFDLAAFYGAGPDFISDPKVFYDNTSERWISSLTDVSTSTVIVAVSGTSDATSNFCVYNFTSSNHLNPDQPILGVNDDKVVVSVNDFDPLSGQFAYSQFWILNKSQMMTCSDVSFVSKTTNDYFSIHPVQSLTRTRTQYMVSTSRNSIDPIIDLFSVRGVPPGQVSVVIYSLQISSISNPPNAIQSSTNLKIDTGDSRVQDAKWSDDSLWMAFNDGCVPSGDTIQRSCLHFVKIDTDKMRIRQDFNYGVAGKYLFYPALAEPPTSKNVFAVFGFSSQSDFPGIGVTSQTKFDKDYSLESPEIMQIGKDPIDLIFGCTFDHICRYGDYFGAAIDPSVDNMVWVAGEYGSGILDPDGFGMGWGTEIGNFIVGRNPHHH